MLFDVLICLSPTASPLPAIIEIPPQYSGCCWREMGFSSSICPSEGKWALTHRSSFPSWDKMLQDSSAHAVPCCGEGRCWQKFLLISSLHPDSFSPLHCMLLSPFRKVGILQFLFFLKVSAQVSTIQVFPSFSSEGLGQVYWLQWLCSLLRCICLLPDAHVGKTPPRSLGIWCWIPQLPQRHFGLDGCLISFYKGGHKVVS